MIIFISATGVYQNSIKFHSAVQCRVEDGGPQQSTYMNFRVQWPPPLPEQVGGPRGSWFNYHTPLSEVPYSQTLALYFFGLLFYSGLSFLFVWLVG